MSSSSIWKHLRREHECGFGISVRTLVELGVYKHFSNIMGRIRKEEIDFVELKEKLLDGRVRSEFLLAPVDAMMLVSTAQTETGRLVGREMAEDWHNIESFELRERLADVVESSVGNGGQGHAVPAASTGSEPGAPASVLEVTVDWASFAVDIDGVRGISVRKLVEVGGLYAQLPQAVRALKSGGFSFRAVVLKSTGGRPSADYILETNEAIGFASGARTQVGRQLRDLIIAHHHKLQEFAAGDDDALCELSDHLAKAQTRAAMHRAEPQQLSLNFRGADALAEVLTHHGDRLDEDQRHNLRVDIAALSTGMDLERYRPVRRGSAGVFRRASRAH